MESKRPRPTIRRVAVKKPQTFDDQIWPLNLAILVLAGFVLGLILARGDFDNPNWLRNGWTWAATLVTTVVGALWIVRSLENQAIRRSMQLSAVLSIIFHLCLVVFLSQYALLFPAIAEKDRRADDERPVETPVEVRVAIPELATEPKDFEQPLTVETPPDETQTTVERRETPQTAEVKPEQAEPEPSKAVVAAIPQPRVEQTVPRRSEQSSKRSRQTTESQPRPVDQAKVPDQRKTDAPDEPKASELANRQSETSAAKNQNSEQPQVEQEVRRESTERATLPDRSLAQNDSATSSRRQRSEDLNVPKTVAPRDPSTGRPKETEPRDPSASDVARRSTPASPKIEREAPQPDVVAEQAPRRTTPPQRQPSDDPAPRVARSDSAPRRPSRELPLRPLSPAAAPSAAPNKSAPDEQPDASSLAQRSTPTTPASQAQQSESSPPSESTAVAPSAVARAESQPTETSTAQSTTESRRVAAAETPQSPAAMVQPTDDAPSAAPNEQPARAALVRGRSGVAGAGQSPNADQGPAAPSSPAVDPSFAARRDRATQQNRAGDAISPSQPSLAQRRRSDRSTPTALVAPDQSPGATQAASEQLADSEADASASLERSDARASIADATADAGTAAVDTGASRVVSRESGQRAAGGGQPNAGAMSRSESVRRRTPGGAPAASAPSAELPAAPDAIAQAAPSTGAIAGGAPSASRSSTSSAVAPSGAEALDPSAIDAAGGEVSAAVVGPAVDDAAESTALARAQRGRRAAGPLLPSVESAAAPQIAGAAGSSGQPDGAPLDAEGSNDASTVDGAAGSASSDLAATRSLGDPRTASRGASIPAGDRAASASSPSESLGLEGEMGIGPLASVAAPDGIGGLGRTVEPDAGVRRRPSSAESNVVSEQGQRIRRRTPLGSLPSTVKARVPADAYAPRLGYRDQIAPGRGGLSTRTEQSIEAGLDFLARHQSADDGRWSFHAFPGATTTDRGIVRSDAAATGLALLSFFGAAYDHYEGKYQGTVAAGLDFLLSQQNDDGGFVTPEHPAPYSNAPAAYTQAIATMALCEAYGMTGDERLRQPAQRAIDFVLAAQSKKYGGWRYEPGDESDTSVTGWQLMALKSGDLARLKIPTQSYDGARRWLDFAQESAEDGAHYQYKPYGEQKGTRVSQRSAVMTSVGLLMRLYLGWNRENPNMTRGADYLLSRENLPAQLRGRRDAYYWYYATQFLFHMGGERWQAWQERLYPILLEGQIDRGRLAGSWDPRGAVGDQWASAGGRIYVTTMHLLTMEVRYRHLPIYEETAK